MPPAAAASSPDLDALVSAVLQGERSTRDAARLALRQAGSAAIPALERRLSDPRWRVRRLVAQLLDNALDERSLPVLERALGDCNAVVRRHSLHSLVCEDCKVGRSWPVDLAGVLLGIIEHDRSRRVRVAALKHLARRPAEPRAIAPLQRLIASRPHPRVQDQAQRVLDGLQRSLTAAQGPGNAAGDGPLT